MPWNDKQQTIHIFDTLCNNRIAVVAGPSHVLQLLIKEIRAHTQVDMSGPMMANVRRLSLPNSQHTNHNLYSKPLLLSLISVLVVKYATLASYQYGYVSWLMWGEYFINSLSRRRENCRQSSGSVCWRWWRNVKQDNEVLLPWRNVGGWCNSSREVLDAAYLTSDINAKFDLLSYLINFNVYLKGFFLFFVSFCWEGGLPYGC